MAIKSPTRVGRHRYVLPRLLIRANAWLRHRWKYSSPVRPDRTLWVDPCEVSSRVVEKPTPSRIPPTFIAGGDWDRALEPVEDDTVYEAFYERFEEGKPWTETGYVDFLAGDVSEHGGRSETEALERCRKIDRLYEYIAENGYKTQAELEREGELIGELTSTLLPPEYREIAVDVTRDGELVWHAGMHRLVIAQLLELEEIPVRVHIRHEQWQEIREAIYTGESHEEHRDHPDIRQLV